jgi:hypothetical protein
MGPEMLPRPIAIRRLVAAVSFVSLSDYPLRLFVALLRRSRRFIVRSSKVQRLIPVLGHLPRVSHPVIGEIFARTNSCCDVNHEQQPGYRARFALT